MSLTKYTKSPSEIKDVNVDFREYLAGFTPADVPRPFQTYSVQADAGITLLSTSLVDAGVVRVWLSGGVPGGNYQVTVTMNTEGGRVKQAAFVMRVREVS